MGVGRRDLDESHVEREDAALEQVRHLAEEDGDVIGLAAGDGATDVAADEEGARMEALAEFGRGIGSRSLGVEVADLDMAKFRRPRRHRLDEPLRRRDGGVDEHAVPGLDDGDGLGGLDDAHGESSRGGGTKRAASPDS